MRAYGVWELSGPLMMFGSSFDTLPPSPHTIVILSKVLYTHLAEDLQTSSKSYDVTSCLSNITLLTGVVFRCIALFMFTLHIADVAAK